MDNIERNKNIEMCLEECKGTLKNLSYKYRSIYNGDTDEAFADACLWLVELYDKFDKDKASFVTYIQHVIENKFLDVYRKNKATSLDIVNKDICELDELGLLPTSEDIYSSSNYDDILTDGQINRYNIYLDNQDYLYVLKEREQDIFKLFYCNMWDISKIASAYGLSEIRIKEIKRKALSKIEDAKNLERFTGNI